MFLTMSIAATPVPLSEAKVRLSELARRVRQQHERITLTATESPKQSVSRLMTFEGLEMTLEILGYSEAVAHLRKPGRPGARRAWR